MVKCCHFTYAWHALICKLLVALSKYMGTVFIDQYNSISFLNWSLVIIWQKTWILTNHCFPFPQGRHELLVEFKYNGTYYYSHYTHFTISGEKDDYELKVSGYSGNGSDTLQNLNGQTLYHRVAERNQSIYTTMKFRPLN